MSEKGSFGPFEFLFAWHKATFLPTVRFATIEDARSELDPMLEAWRVQSIITNNYSMLFSYVDHGLAEASPESGAPQPTPKRRPMPPSNVQVLADATHYPPPPSHWVMDECTRDLVAHYEESLGASRTLLMHAYAMVTRVEFAHGSLPQAGKALRISLDILKWVKSMASERTIEGRARKYKTNTPLEPLAPVEDEHLRWIIRELANRSFNLASGIRPEKTVSFIPGSYIADRIQRDRLRQQSKGKKRK
ncbi:MAG TPA: hypothetical protein VGI93_09665 [Steroidobacteraceae bacterium]|jgi:hypothetical protein